jgi:hypothetical protein
MSNESLIEYFKSLGWHIEVILGSDRLYYTVIRDYHINVGSLVDRICDVAIQQNNTIPFVLSSAIHTRPHLVPMNMQNALRTQNSGIGAEWQYWSRILTKEPTPQNIVAHIATIF